MKRKQILIEREKLSGEQVAFIIRFARDNRIPLLFGCVKILYSSRQLRQLNQYENFCPTCCFIIREKDEAMIRMAF